MADCGGLNVMLLRLASIMDTHYSKPLLQVLLKLLSYCIRVKKNREKLIGSGMDSQGSFRAIPVLLHCLKLSLAAEEDGHKVHDGHGGGAGLGGGGGVSAGSA